MLSFERKSFIMISANKTTERISKKLNTMDYITKLLGLQEAKIENIEANDEKIVISLVMNRKKHKCPCCGADTDKIHDYRTQLVTDLDLREKQVVLKLRKRRYVCPHCGKRFCENIHFLPRYFRRTVQVTASIVNYLRESVSYSYVARKHHVSVATVLRVFDHVGYGAAPLPRVLLIDEFRGNAGKEKFQCILMNGETGEIVDILPSRKYADLALYFSKKDTSTVEFFVSDLWKPYRDLCRTCFKKAKHIADKYHVIRQTGWAMEAVRKEEQKELNKHSRLRYKRTAHLLRKPKRKLKDEEKTLISQVFFASPKLENAYNLKERFYDVFCTSNRTDACERLKDWCLISENSNIKRFQTCAKTMAEWSTSILNSVEYGYTNGMIEGMNNKIKVLKRVSYGVRKFQRFRNRILHLD